MKIECPICRQVIGAEQINVSTDIAMCVSCNETFRVSEMTDLEVMNADTLANPPDGAWYREDIDHVTIGASTRSWIALFIVPFMCVWSGGSLGGIYGTQIAKGEFNLEMSLFGIPFVLGTVVFGAFAVMSVCGKIEVELGRDRSRVFVGVGRLGWTRNFDWSDVRTISEQPTMTHYPGGYNTAILLDGTSRLKFGTNLNESRRYFVMNALKNVKAVSK
jgi:hypothetical protein